MCQPAKYFTRSCYSNGKRGLPGPTCQFATLEEAEEHYNGRHTGIAGIELCERGVADDGGLKTIRLKRRGNWR